MNSYSFQLTDSPITRESGNFSDGAGAAVSFAGVVRPDAKNGNKVTGIVYEAHPTLAESEGKRVLEAVASQFQLLTARCIHRIGLVRTGEASIWVECCALHRHDAFAACEEIMDRIKQTVPIWKQEILENGEAQWKDGPTPIASQNYFQRQLSLKEIGSAGQEKLQSATVVLVGAGGLGCIIARLLAGAGIGKLKVIDHDTVAEPDLHRQLHFNRRDIGVAKVLALQHHLALACPFTEVEAMYEELTPANATTVFKGANLVIDAVDTFAGKLAINDSCLGLRIPFIHGALSQWQGEVMMVEPDWPCLRCLWRSEPVEGCVGRCRDEGVFGPVPNLVGTIMANEALKRLVGMDSALAPGHLTLVDGFDLGIRTLKIGCWKDCPVCHSGSASNPATQSDPLSIEPSAPKDFQHYRVISIEKESPESGMKEQGIAVEYVPNLLALELDFGSKPILVVCRNGYKSQVVAKHLRENKGVRAYSLTGGTEGWLANHN